MPIRNVNVQTVNLIKRKEGLSLRPYICPAGVPTIGIGTIKYPPWYRGGASVSMSDPPITLLLAEQFLDYDLDRFERRVSDVIRVPTNDNEHGAMVSLAYNIGEEGFAGSSVARLLNAGNRAGAVRAFAMWNKAKIGGELQELPGLTVRRREEQALFETPVVAVGDPLAAAVPPPPEPLPLVEMPPELPMPQALFNSEQGPVQAAVKSKSIMTDVGAATILTGGAATVAEKVIENPDQVLHHVTTATGLIGGMKGLVFALGGWKIALMVGGLVVAGLLIYRAIRYFKKMRNMEVISK